MTATTSRLGPLAAIVLANVMLSFGALLVRLADVGAVAAGFWRMALAIPFLLMMGLAARQPLRAVPRRALAPLGLAAFFFAADLATWHVGIRGTTLANATLFGNTSSFLFPLWGFWAARAWPSRTQGLALLLAGAGVALLLGRSYNLAPENLVGDLLCIVAAAAFAAYLVVLGRVDPATPPLPLLTLVCLGNLPLLGLTALAFGERVWPGDWTPLVLLALGSQVVGQGLVLYALSRLPPLVIGLCLLIQPVVAAAIGWAWFGETLALPDYLGAAMIGAALVLVRRGG